MDFCIETILDVVKGISLLCIICSNISGGFVAVIS